ncbi:MAG: C1 family peptidase [Thermacetogeniaceae bacterium]
MRGFRWKAVSVIVTMMLLFTASFPAFASGSTPKHHRLGRLSSDKSTLSQHSLAARALNSTLLPSSENWTANMPPVGDQGTQGSCVAWSVGYAYKSYQDQVLRDWGDTTPNHEFSPAYIYNQLDGGVDDGISIASAMNLLVSQGCDTLDDMPYNQNDYTTQPTALQKARAAQFKEASWSSVPLDSQLYNIKYALTNGPVEAGVLVYWSNGWLQTGDINIADIAGLSPAGGHGICIVGYDDNHQMEDGTGALEFINSWGTGATAAMAG